MSSLLYHKLPFEQITNAIGNIKQPAIILDSASDISNNSKSFLFINPKQILEVWEYSKVAEILEQIDTLSKKYWICGFFSYEASFALEEKFIPFQKNKTNLKFPLIWFGIFEEPYIFDHSTGKWNKPISTFNKNLLPTVKQNKGKISPSISSFEFKNNIKKIKKYISDGDIYQVNYTFDVEYQSFTNEINTYLNIRENQPVLYGAYIQNDYGHILSYSPELFFEKHGSKIKTKPMKGTAKRGLWSSDDKNIKIELSNDEKNKAENVMIVDLLRNDLGKICKTGTVFTDSLFDVETHPTLHQMTSTISGTLRKNINYSQIFKNLFPCGSITGAPKIRSMEIINEIEKGSRGVYTGAIGYISPKGDSVFNIPIRTLEKGKSDLTWRFRVGSGIVWDSGEEGEWNECKNKMEFLTFETPEFSIIETFLWNGRLVYKSEHIKRMENSAKFFNFTFSINKLKEVLQKIETSCYKKNDCRVRILLNKYGEFSFEIYPLTILTKSRRLILSHEKIDQNNVFLYHKTTHRPWYEKALKNIRNNECYDTVFLNKNEELTECSINNIFIEKDGILSTPPLNSGLLGGVLRNRLIKSKKCVEQVLYKKDLLEADKIFCGNSVRGLKRVYFRE